MTEPPDADARQHVARGLVVGRFQPFHKGHESLVRLALEETDHVVIAIGSSQAGGTPRDPFTAEQRRAMLDAVFGRDIAAGHCSVVEVPDIFDPPHWVAHALRITGSVDRVYGNDDATMRLFDEMGAATARPGLARRAEWQAAVIRRKMADGDASWQDAVPAAVARFLEKIEAPARLHSLVHGGP